MAYKSQEIIKIKRWSLELTSPIDIVTTIWIATLIPAKINAFGRRTASSFESSVGWERQERHIAVDSYGGRVWRATKVDIEFEQDARGEVVTNKSLEWQKISLLVMVYINISLS